MAGSWREAMAAALGMAGTRGHGRHLWPSPAATAESKHQNICIFVVVLWPRAFPVVTARDPEN